MTPLAIIPVYNEADVLPSVLAHLRSQGCEVRVLDNWSTDESAAIAVQYGATVERWPPEEPPAFYDWTAILCRIEEIAQPHTGRWIIFHDADEIRRVPAQFGSATLADALDSVQREGYNAVDHHVTTFVPVDESYAGGDLEGHFQCHLQDHVDRHIRHVKAWIQGAERVDLHSTGGHQAVFPGACVYPRPFVLKHYPVRSQAHGERKVLVERLPRYSSAERRLNWHVQYDAYAHNPRFVKRKEELIRWRNPVAICTLTGFPEIFEHCIAGSVDRLEPSRRRLVVASRGMVVARSGWTTIQGVEPFVFAANLNAGIRAAGADCDVLCVNDDVTLTSSIIDTLQQVLSMDEHIGIVSPQVDGGIGLQMAQAGYPIPGSCALSQERIPFVCVLLRREMLNRIGLLDERFDGYGGDDVEYCQRALAAGFKLAVTPLATVKHGYGERRYSSSFLRVMTADEREQSMSRMNEKAERARAEHICHA